MRSWFELGPIAVPFGRMPGDGGYSLWTIMREAGSLELLPEMEVIDGVKTYLLKSVGKYGEHQIWLDPASGALPRRIAIHKHPGNLFNDEQLGTTTVPNADAPPDSGGQVLLPPLPPRSESSTRIDKIQIEKKEGVFVITGFDEEATITYSDEKMNQPPNDGKRPPRKVEYRFQVDIDPQDFPEDAFRFAIAIPNGTRVAVMNDYPVEYQGSVKLEHEWVDGKIQRQPGK